jgi:transcriptional regulator with XRE-family HTH domain
MQRADPLRLLLGLKLRALRQERGLGLKELAARTGVSVSYLSEIESGKKYPKPDRLVELAGALGTSYEELVSAQVTEPLGAVKTLLQAPLVQEFPFALFGLDARQLLELMTDAPEKAGALMRALLDIGRSYDVSVEHFLLAALRSYQQMNANYFADLEAEAAAFREAQGWPSDRPLAEAELERTLRERWGYQIDDTTLAADPELRSFRSVYREREPTLFINGELLAPQRAFLLAREIGYRHLRLAQRALTSSWLEVTSFEQVLANFRASYFAGALLLDARSVERALQRFFQRRRWSGAAFLALIEQFGVTAEMFFYRLTELVPERFALPEIYFLRFVQPAGSYRFEMSKVFNLSQVPVPHGVGFDEAYCRRWLAIRTLAGLAEAPQRVAAQRSRFLDDDVEFFEIAVARPLTLEVGTASAVSLGFRIDEAFRRRVRFADDPAVPRVDVNLTCERCGLAPCAERAAAPVRFERAEALARRRAALDFLLR